MKFCGCCREPLVEDATECPKCRLKVGIAALNAGLDRGVSAAIERKSIELLLERHDVSVRLTRELSEQEEHPLALADIDTAMERPEGAQVPALKELEAILESDVGSSISLNSMQVGALLEDGVDTGRVLRQGIILLRHHRYTEALEWWALNRQRLAQPGGRADLLMLVMELLSHTLRGDEQRATLARNQMVSHPSFHYTQRAR